MFWKSFIYKHLTGNRREKEGGLKIFQNQSEAWSLVDDDMEERVVIREEMELNATSKTSWEQLSLTIFFTWMAYEPPSPRVNSDIKTMMHKILLLYWLRILEAKVHQSYSQIWTELCFGSLIFQNNNCYEIPQLKINIQRKQ